MRLAFWRAGRDKALVQRAIAKPAPATYQPATAPSSGDLDMRALGEALARKRGWIIVPTVLAAVLSITAVNLVTPRYKSEARILIDGRENVFLRPSPARSSCCCRAISHAKSSRRTSSPSGRNSIRCCRACRRSNRCWPCLASAATRSR
jgi:hypothetical protein